MSLTKEKTLSSTHHNNKNVCFTFSSLIKIEFNPKLMSFRLACFSYFKKILCAWKQMSINLWMFFSVTLFFTLNIFSCLPVKKFHTISPKFCISIFILFTSVIFPMGVCGVKNTCSNGETSIFKQTTIISSISRIFPQAEFMSIYSGNFLLSFRHD